MTIAVQFRIIQRWHHLYLLVLSLVFKLNTLKWFHLTCGANALLLAYQSEKYRCPPSPAHGTPPCTSFNAPISEIANCSLTTLSANSDSGLDKTHGGEYGSDSCQQHGKICGLWVWLTLWLWEVLVIKGVALYSWCIACSVFSPSLNLLLKIIKYSQFLVKLYLYS